jgi:triacylglycerol esterase/lipase EstA (alpha/beta hydrolase family)
MRCIRFLPGMILLLALAGCATPVGVNKANLEDSYREITANTLAGDTLSSDTRVVLHRFDLMGRYEEDPAAAIATLHEKLFKDPRRDLRFALAELSFNHGEQLEKQPAQGGNEADGHAADYYLMSAIYAYYYLFGTMDNQPPGAYDRRFRVACDLYNRALGKGLATGVDGRLEFKDGVRKLPFGQLAISLNTAKLRWPLANFVSFLPADDFTVRGLTLRNRTPGLGLPLVALHKKTPEMPNGPGLPITVFLRLPEETGESGGGSVSATLEFYSAYEETEVTVNGRTVPLETDTTAPLAYKLNDAQIWDLGIRKFLSAMKLKKDDLQALTLVQPYQPGRIPVVFVHGTASSPVWWAEMWNTLRSDPVLRKRCLFWFFMYDSSEPVAKSAAALRDALTAKVAQFDPEGKDPALRQMVVIGHSQGGLLTKMSVVNTGDRLWKSISDLTLEELKAGPTVKEELRKYFFIERLPFVTRVVYISTPFRGSFRAKPWVRNLVRRLVTLPKDILTRDPSVYVTLFAQSKLPIELRTKFFTSVDSMSPENPVMQTLAGMPVAPGVTAHSIISVKGDGDPVKGNDGVVEYTSAHQEGVASEFIVRSEHSCQGNPFTIEEVRRILHEHLTASSLEKADDHVKAE